MCHSFFFGLNLGNNEFDVIELCKYQYKKEKDRKLSDIAKIISEKLFFIGEENVGKHKPRNNTTN